jgi:predicted enzyme related to lactoylglutathione lyase
MGIMQFLGIDNVFFEVGDLEKATSFYDQLGFKLKFTIPHISSALFNIGNEEPGLLIQEVKIPKPSKLWLEIKDAHQAKEKCSQLGIEGTILETATGFTFEFQDPWSNVIGFADYLKKPDLGRKTLL